jgi:transposase
MDHLDAAIAELSIAIGARLDGFEAMIERFSAVPGVKRTTAEIVIAETGGDSTVVPTPERLCSWAGVAPPITNRPASIARPAPATAADGCDAP